MTEPTPTSGGPGSFLDRLALSSWRFLALMVLCVVPFAALFLLRGMRGVILAGVALVGAAFCLTAFSQPFWTLVAALFLYFSSLDVFLPGPMALLLLLLVGSRAAFDVLSGRKLDWGTTTFRVATIFLLVIALTSLLMARSFERAEGPIWHFVWGLLFYVGISSFVKRGRQARLLLACMAIAFASNIALYLGRFVRSGNLLFLLHPTADQRVGVGDTNTSAVVACVLLLPLIHVMGQGSIRRRLLMIPVVLLLVTSVILSVSRIGMALLGLILLIVVLRARRARPYAILGLAVLGIILAGLPSKYWVRFTDLGQLGGILIDRSLRLRQHALEAGWQIFLEHPWLGIGLGNFSSESPRYLSIPIWAHNAYLDVAATLGIFGFLAFIAWQASGVAMVGRAHRLWRVSGSEAERSLAFAIGGSLLLLYVAALTLDLAFHPYLWIFFGLANAVRLMAEADSA